MAEYRLILSDECISGDLYGSFFKEKIQLENNHSCVEFYGAGALVF